MSLPLALPAIATDNLTVLRDGKLILDRVTFEVEPGRLVGVTGPNGAGKSTLFDSLAGLVQGISGDVRFFGRPLHEVRGRLAYVPQHERINWSMPVRVQDVVLQGRVRGFQLFRRPQATDLQATETALQQTGIWQRRRDLMVNLSTGQRQRVFLARALAQQADILLFDESMSSVDQHSQMQLTATLQQLRDQGKTILMVSHDLDDVANACDECLWVNERVVVKCSSCCVTSPHGHAAAAA